jgi:hypothetical protein
MSLDLTQAVVSATLGDGGQATVLRHSLALSEKPKCRVESIRFCDVWTTKPLAEANVPMETADEGGGYAEEDEVG